MFTELSLLTATSWKQKNVHPPHQQVFLHYQQNGESFLQDKKIFSVHFVKFFNPTASSKWPSSHVYKTIGVSPMNWYHQQWGEPHVSTSSSFHCNTLLADDSDAADDEEEGEEGYGLG